MTILSTIRNDTSLLIILATDFDHVLLQLVDNDIVNALFKY